MQEVPVVTSASGACCINTTMLMSMGLEKTLLENSPGWHYLSTTAEAPNVGDAHLFALSQAGFC